MLNLNHKLLKLAKNRQIGAIGILSGKILNIYRGTVTPDVWAGTHQYQQLSPRTIMFLLKTARAHRLDIYGF